MCGIVGYVGDRKDTVQVLLEGLSRLEYRGYDSSGIAVMEDGHPKVFKSTGKLENLGSWSNRRYSGRYTFGDESGTFHLTLN